MKSNIIISLALFNSMLFCFAQNAFSADNISDKQERLRLRDSAAGLALKSDNAKGARLSFSDNHLKDNGSAWNSNGALGYSFDLSNTKGSVNTVMIPAFSWNVNKQAGLSSKDVEELKINYLISCEYARQTSYSAFWRIGINPYYLTDFSFEDQIYGAEASAEFIGKPLGSFIFLGDYMNVKSASPMENVLQYQLRLVPKINYSVTGKGGVHTTRVKGDDWFCVGGLTSLGLRFRKDFPVELGVSYEFMEVLNGKASNVHVFSSFGKWLLDNKNVALTLTYSKGKTIDTAQKVDLLAMGLELKH